MSCGVVTVVATVTDTCRWVRDENVLAESSPATRNCDGGTDEDESIMQRLDKGVVCDQHSRTVPVGVRNICGLS